MTTLRQEAKTLLAAAGAAPVRALGQCFLVDPNIHQRLVRCFSPQAEEVVIEIGPGLGFLTRALSPHVRRVVGIERDRRAAAILAAELRAERATPRDCSHPGGNVSLVVADAMLPPLPRHGCGARFIGNLPYHIAVPLLVMLSRTGMGVGRSIFLVQLELAARLGAPPGSPARGAPSVLFQTRCRLQVLFRVGRSAFWPQPKVDSVAVEATFGECPEGSLPWSAAGHATTSAAPSPRQLDLLFDRLVRGSFTHRRKRLSNGIALAGIASRACATAALQRAELPDERPEMLSIGQFAALTLQLCEAAAPEPVR
ncbi:MAG: ribosomal RNA small subunit methyltransferase A [Candidatus Schekmanbacteria bacterium]|nr:ribosomal RNA small subunit methyltransferase A [Candidatus Schekmanbacteria bacterium]